MLPGSGHCSSCRGSPMQRGGVPGGGSASARRSWRGPLEARLFCRFREGEGVLSLGPSSDAPLEGVVFLSLVIAKEPATRVFWRARGNRANWRHADRMSRAAGLIGAPCNNQLLRRISPTKIPERNPDGETVQLVHDLVSATRRHCNAIPVHSRPPLPNSRKQRHRLLLPNPDLHALHPRPLSNTNHALAFPKTALPPTRPQPPTRKPRSSVARPLHQTSRRGPSPYPRPAEGEGFTTPARGSLRNAASRKGGGTARSRCGKGAAFFGGSVWIGNAERRRVPGSDVRVLPWVFVRVGEDEVIKPRRRACREGATLPQDEDSTSSIQRLRRSDAPLPSRSSRVLSAPGEWPWRSCASLTGRRVPSSTRASPRRKTRPGQICRPPSGREGPNRPVGRRAHRPKAGGGDSARSRSRDLVPRAETNAYRTREATRDGAPAGHRQCPGPRSPRARVRTGPSRHTGHTGHTGLLVPESPRHTPNHPAQTRPVSSP